MFKGLLTMGAYNIHKQAGQQRERTQTAIGQARAGMPKIELNEQERTALIERQARAAEGIKIEMAQRERAVQRTNDQEFHEQRMQEGERIGLTGVALPEDADPEKYKLTPEPRTARLGARTPVQATGPDGKTFTAYRGLDENGVEQLYKLGGNVPLDPSKYSQTMKEAGESGAEVKENETALRNIHPEWDEARVKREASQMYLNNQADKAKARETGITSGQLNISLKREELPGSGGTVAAPAAGQRPYDNLNPKQKILVTNAINMLSSGTSLGFGQRGRTQLNEAKRVIEESTGLTPEEIDFRVDRRKAAKNAFGKLTLLKASTEGLFNSLDRAATILTNLRPQLPDTDVTKINEWLQSGALEFNVAGVSAPAVQYGLALAAVRNEYARVIAGGAASAAQTPVEAIHIASQNIRAGFNSANTKAMVDQMRTEGKQSIGGRQDELNSLASETRQPLFPELFGQQYQNQQTVPQPAGGGAKPIVQHSPSTGQYRYSTDGGKTWQQGQPPR